MGKLSNSLNQLDNSRHWNNSTLDCYYRHCICNGCTIVPERFIEECCIKNYVLLTYARHGKPNKSMYKKFRLKSSRMDESKLLRQI